MNKNLTPRPRWLTTAEFAEALNLKPESVRKRYWLFGSYFGVVPVRGKNRLLRWPGDGVEQV